MGNNMEMPSFVKKVKSTTESAVKMEDVTLFGKLLSKARSVINKQSNEIAEKLGVTPSVVSAWENGRAFPEEERLPDIADVFGIKLEELIRVLEISKKARQIEKDTRNPRKFVPRGRSDIGVYGPGGDNGHRQSPKNSQP